MALKRREVARMLRTSADPSDVTRTPEIWGGAAVIAGSAIPVFMVEDLYNDNYRVEDVLENYPWLSKGDVLRALAYAADAPHLVAADRARHAEAIAKHAPGN
jgi:uncharacterized protein (DUF433 family)